MSPVTYTGIRDSTDTLRVTKQVDDLLPKPLDPRLDLRNHSPTGLECGYQGSGPAQLSIALLADVLGDEEAQELYQRYKRDVVARLPREGFSITAEAIEEWAKGIEKEEHGQH